MAAVGVSEDTSVLDGLDFDPPCQCVVHEGDRPVASWYRVLGCGCVCLQCDDCAGHDGFVASLQGGVARCQGCDVRTRIVVHRRLRE